MILHAEGKWEALKRQQVAVKERILKILGLHSEVKSQWG